MKFIKLIMGQPLSYKGIKSFFKHYCRVIIRIYHGCDSRIEKIPPEDHRLALRGMPSDDKR